MTSKIKILVVEDEGVIAMNVKMALMRNGYEVLPIAMSAETALIMTAQYHPDVVLMDIRIRGDKDGIDTAILMSEHYNVPIIYTTAHYDEATVQRALKTKHSGYLLKPYREKKLLEIIENTVGTQGRAAKS